jgi:hypothetical protein
MPLVGAGGCKIAIRSLFAQQRPAVGRAPLAGGDGAVPFRLFFTGLPATVGPGSPSLHSMLVVQPDRRRHELG